MEFKGNLYRVQEVCDNRMGDYFYEGSSDHNFNTNFNFNLNLDFTFNPSDEMIKIMYAMMNLEVHKEPMLNQAISFGN